MHKPCLCCDPPHCEDEACAEIGALWPCKHVFTVTVSGAAWSVCCDPRVSGVPREENWPEPEMKPVGRGFQFVYANITFEMAGKILTHLEDYAEGFLTGGDEPDVKRDGRYCRDAAYTVRKQIRKWKESQVG